MRPWPILVVIALLALPGRAAAATAGPSRVPAGAATARALRVPAGASRTVVVRGPAELVSLRVRGCERSSVLRLAVDGHGVTRVRVRRRARVRPVGVTVRSGRHRLRLAAARGGCRAGLRVDWLRWRSVAVPPAPAKPAPAPPAAVPAAPTAPSSVPPAPAAAPVTDPGPAAGSVPLGSALAWPRARDDSAYAAALLRTFGAVTPENALKMEWLQPSPGRFDFVAADAAVDWALAHDLPVRGHTLIWGNQLPWWITRYAQQYTPELLATVLRDHVTAVAEHFAGRVREWDVVNEALTDAGGWRSNPWLDVLGPQYVAMAFRAARAADPGARLFYNELAAEAPGPKQDAEVAMLGGLLADGVPVDGVGLQLHTTIWGAPTRAQLEATMRRFAALGLEVQITEADVDAAGSPQTAPERHARQAAVFADAAAACRAVPACTRFTVWGVDDGDSWKGVDADALLLDRWFVPKPALAAVRAGLDG